MPCPPHLCALGEKWVTKVKGGGGGWDDNSANSAYWYNPSYLRCLLLLLTIWPGGELMAMLEKNEKLRSRQSRKLHQKLFLFKHILLGFEISFIPLQNAGGK